MNIIKRLFSYIKWQLTRPEYLFLDIENYKISEGIILLDEEAIRIHINDFMYRNKISIEEYAFEKGIPVRKKNPTIVDPAFKYFNGNMVLFPTAFSITHTTFDSIEKSLKRLLQI